MIERDVIEPACLLSLWMPNDCRPNLPGFELVRTFPFEIDSRTATILLDIILVSGSKGDSPVEADTAPEVADEHPAFFDKTAADLSRDSAENRPNICER